MELDPPPEHENGTEPAGESPFDLSEETPPDELGTTPTGLAVCLYEHFPDAGSPALELFDPETLERSLETFDDLKDAESRFRELTAEEEQNGGR